VAADPVSLGTYGIDAHEIRRIVKDGVVTREGKLAEGRDGAGPYGISYRAIVPKQAECDNLLVTFALSASHVAFSSIRMEPVFMVSSQTAATAAAMAIDDGVPVQAVDYAKLRARLVDDGQILGVPAPPPQAPKNAAKPDDVNSSSSAARQAASPVRCGRPGRASACCSSITLGIWEASSPAAPAAGKPPMTASARLFMVR
jgi:hypothetical protein